MTDSCSPDKDDVAAIESWCITTESGSRYVVIRMVDGWCFCGRNRPNPTSCALPEGLCRIEAPQPWPPVLGAGVVLLALSSLDLGDPTRVPGGGKVTSPVQSIDALPVAGAMAFLGCSARGGSA